MSIFSQCSVSIFSLCYVSIFSLCYVRFLVCVMCGVYTRRTRAPRVWLASLASGRFAAVAAASRLQAISPNIIVFVVRGLTFVNVSALGIKCGGNSDCLMTSYGHFYTSV